MGKFLEFLTELSACNMPDFFFSGHYIELGPTSKYQWILPNLVFALIL